MRHRDQTPNKSVLNSETFCFAKYWLGVCIQNVNSTCYKTKVADWLPHEKKFGAHTHLTTHFTSKVLQYYHNSK